MQYEFLVLECATIQFQILKEAGEGMSSSKAPLAISFSLFLIPLAVLKLKVRQNSTVQANWAAGARLFLCNLSVFRLHWRSVVTPRDPNVAGWGRSFSGTPEVRRRVSDSRLVVARRRFLKGRRVESELNNNRAVVPLLRSPSLLVPSRRETVFH